MISMLVFVSIIAMIIQNDQLTYPFAKASNVICTGDYYFKLSDDGEPITKFPPSNTKCDVINGTLFIQQYDNSYMEYIPISIQSVKQINGTFTIKQSKNYPLFDNLNEIGYFHIDYTSFEEAESLDSIKVIKKGLNIGFSENIDISFPNLIQLGSIQIEYTTIQNFDLPSLKECGTVALSHSRFPSLTGLKNLEKINGDFKIVETTFPSLDMSSLESVKGNIIVSEIYYKPLDISFANGIEIGGDLEIVDNDNAVTLKNNAGSINIHGSIVIRNNDGWMNLDGLYPIRIGNSLIVELNSGKIQLFDASKIAKFHGSVIIRDNIDLKQPRFKSLQFIGGNFAIPTTVKNNETVLHDYPALREVNGTLIFQGVMFLTDMQIVNSFSFIRSLDIRENYKLSSMDGLDRITKLGSLTIEQNSNLKSLKGLKNLIEVTGKMAISYNNRLFSLEGLEKTKSVGQLNIEGNNNIRTMQGLANLINIQSELRVSDNLRLSSLDGLSKLKHAGSVYIERNKNLGSLHGVNNLQDISGSLSIYNNNKLVSFEGLSNIKQLGSLYIGYNSNVETLVGLKELTAVNGEVWIAYNDKLLNLEGLNKLSRAGSLLIGGNSNLSGLKGLDGLLDVDSSLSIYNNDKLLSLEGLDNINNIGSLNIEYNNNLEHINGMNELIRVKSINIYFDEKTNIELLNIGKEKSNLGNPQVIIYKYNISKHAAMTNIKSFLDPICNKKILIHDSQINCS